ncbi:A1pp-domain-containing protein [Pholiota conissans]|uniref:A1pp-domain-containing protein n=1 Tax=Pholiota conissans TaxID=109636 RepID=A0A9P5ZBW4_9AGAR|nr:A1pp-domain-containing protein [Pholiota conissans]
MAIAFRWCHRLRTSITVAAKMSTPDSPNASSDSEFDDEEQIPIRPASVKLQDIKTIAALFESGVLKPATSEKLQYKPDPTLLERVSLYQGDITRVDVDAIVNAANRSLLGSGGVDGAIHAAAGRKLLEECRELNGCLTGESKITRGYNLPARHIIHTVGPVYTVREKEEKAAQLTSSYKTSLEVAVENAIRHVAFPSISTGIYSYPIVSATRIALDTVRKCLETEEGSKLERVIFVVWSDKDKEVYETLIPEYFPIGEKPESPEPVAEPESVTAEPEA